MVRWLMYLGGAFALLVLIVTGIGCWLPVEHVASRAAIFNKPAADVFAAITDVRSYPEWRADVSSVEVLSSSPRLRWKERGGNGDITFEVEHAAPPTRVVARIADPELPFGGRWTYDLVPQGSGTQLTITEHGEVYNPIFRFMSRFVFGHTSTIEQFLAALQRRLA